jgi:hypothetical protein
MYQTAKSNRSTLSIVPSKVHDVGTNMEARSRTVASLDHGPSATERQNRKDGVKTLRIVKSPVD